MTRRGQIADLTGKQYGDWTVLGQGPRTKRDVVTWRVRCACGLETVHQGGNLKNGASQSCPVCRRVACDAAVNDLLASYRWGARRRGHVFGLEANRFRSLVLASCHYCGSEPQAAIRHAARFEYAPTVNGIDRVDNALGYVAGNVVTCCAICNRAKQTMPVDNFLAWIARLVAFRGAVS